MNGLKLFVVGHSSPTPDDWPSWGGWSLVVAERPDQATELVGDVATKPTTEVDISKPTMLVHVPFKSIRP